MCELCHPDGEAKGSRLSSADKSRCFAPLNMTPIAWYEAQHISEHGRDRTARQSNLAERRTVYLFSFAPARAQSGR